MAAVDFREMAWRGRTILALLGLAAVGRADEVATAADAVASAVAAGDGEALRALAAKGDFGMLAMSALLVFPKLALGLSGFETGVTVMPLIDGGAQDAGHDPRTHMAPRGRVANTRKLLLLAAGRYRIDLAHVQRMS